MFFNAFNLDWSVPSCYFVFVSVFINSLLRGILKLLSVEIDKHAFSLLNGSSHADKSASPKYGPLYFLHPIAIDGSLHGKDVCVVKLKSIAAASLFLSRSDVH